MTLTPTVRLEQEHERILQLLSVLDALARRFRTGERPVEHAREALDLLRTFADEGHHGKEELHLFPALNDAGLPRHGGPVAVMLLEHDAGRRELDDMACALTALAAGLADGAARFASAALDYVGLLHDHIEKENLVLFPMACDLLGPDVAARLEAGYAAVDAEVFGPGGYARALARIDALVGAVGAVGAGAPIRRRSWE